MLNQVYERASEDDRIEYCQAVVPITQSYSPTISIPCNQTFDKASYICDMRTVHDEARYKIVNNSMKVRIIQRMDKECIYNWTRIAFKCVTVIFHFQACNTSRSEGNFEACIGSVSRSERNQLEANAELTTFVDILYITRNITQIHYKEVVAKRSLKLLLAGVNRWWYYKEKYSKEDVKHMMCQSSEFEVVEHSCTSQHYQCADESCIPLVFLCDGIYQCLDQSDETNCTTQCKKYNTDTFLIPFASCYCSQSYFLCRSGQCIHINSVCNGREDCQDGSDEVECANFKTIPNTEETLNDLCIYNPNNPQLQTNKLILCYFINCTRHFKCRNNYCVPLSLVCNGELDCSSGEDEEGCGDGVVCRGLLQCSTSRVCVHPDNICDGIPDCINDDDEILCNSACPDNCSCDGYITSCSASEYLELNNEHQARSLLLSSISNDSHIEIYCKQLLNLNMSNNRLKVLKKTWYSNLARLVLLDISQNQITHLMPLSFEGLFQLRVLLLHGNSIKLIQSLTFDGLFAVEILNLRNLSIQSLEKGAFQGLKKIKLVDLSENAFHLKKDIFQGLEKLQYFSLGSNDITISDYKIFKDLLQLRYISFLYKSSCCYVTQEAKCSHKTNDLSLLSSCKTLLSSIILRILVWLSALIIALLNISTLAFWIILKHSNLNTHVIGVIWLALSDLFLGVYLFIIAASDAHYQGWFLQVTLSWKKSMTCRTASTLLLTSAQMSTSSLLMMSIIKLYSFKYPFKSALFSKFQYSLLLLSLTWLWIAVGSMVSQSLHLANDVCFILDLRKPEENLPVLHMVSTVSVFLLLWMNFFSLVAVLMINVYIIILIQRSAKSSNSTNTKKVRPIILRTLLVSISNFLSWFVVIPVMTLLFAGVEVDPSVISWISVVGLPLNSMLNPILYTFSTPAFYTCIQKKRSSTTNKPQ